MCSHGCSNIFSAEGIKYCVEYFQKMGHDVKAVIPLFRRNPNKSSNPALLDQLHKEGKIVFTPCKNLPNQQSISYDDRCVMSLIHVWIMLNNISIYICFQRIIFQLYTTIGV